MSENLRIKIEVQDLAKAFGGLLVLEKINFQIHRFLPLPKANTKRQNR